jgi:lipopolysaccharide export system permease protein
MILSTLDRYLLRRALAPMTAVLLGTMVAFLMERLTRSFDLLSQTTNGMRFLSELLVNLAPHYLGLTLPGGFFIGLFVVVSGLNRSSEIDAILASGISLDRFARPFVGLGVLLALLSALLSGFIQPYSRYAYHAVLRAAENAGWNGDVRPRALLLAGPDTVLTADGADIGGRHLRGVFIRKIGPGGREDILTAGAAEIGKPAGDGAVTLDLNDGQQVSITPDGQAHVVTFEAFALDLPLTALPKRLRPRGGEVSELTLIELAQRGFGAAIPALPRQDLRAELYLRLARAMMFPLLPLLAVPFALSAKRAGAAPAMAAGGLLLFGFETSIVLGQGLAASGVAPAAVSIGLPAGLFATACIATWITSRKRPGENPVNWLAEHIAELFAAAARAVGVRRAVWERSQA